MNELPRSIPMPEQAPEENPSVVMERLIDRFFSEPPSIEERLTAVELRLAELEKRVEPAPVKIEPCEYYPL